MRNHLGFICTNKLISFDFKVCLFMEHKCNHDINKSIFDS